MSFFTRFISRHHLFLLSGLLVAHVGLLAYSARYHSPVIDEPAHLAAGVSHWQLGDFALYRVNPPLVRMVAAAPVLFSGTHVDWSQHSHDLSIRREFLVGDDFIRANGSRVFDLMTLARWACIPFSLAGALVCFHWGRLLFGKAAGLAAATLWCFSPTILGHGSLITPDVGATALGAAACYCFARWLVTPTLRRALAAGLLLGLAEACKATWIILFPAFPAIWLLFRLGLPRVARRPPGRHLILISAIGWGILSATYGMNSIGLPLQTVPFQSQLFRSLLCSEEPDGSYAVRPLIANAPVPLPRDYLVGLDQQYRDLEGPQRSFLRGAWSSEGWWFYYAYGLLIKEPCGALFLAGCSLALWLGISVSSLRKRISQRRLAHLYAAALLSLCPALVLAIASANTGMNHHVRYVMPVVPYLYIGGCGLLTRRAPFRLTRTAIGVGLSAYVVSSSLLAFPHSLSYFNELAGGSANGIKHLNNSNIDWGQDLLALARWKREYAADESIHFAYFGRVHPIYADIQYRVPPLLSEGHSSAVIRKATAQRLEPGWYAISVTLLQGRKYTVQSPGGNSIVAHEGAFSYFQEMTPIGRAGQSIYIYKVPSSQISPSQTSATSAMP